MQKHENRSFAGHVLYVTKNQPNESPNESLFAGRDLYRATDVDEPKWIPDEPPNESGPHM